MRTTQVLAVGAGLFSTFANGLALHKQQSGPAKVLGLDIKRRTIHNPVSQDKLRRRTTTVLASLDNEETLYFANVSIGTPAQTVRLQIDTGSSDLWVNTPTSTECETKSQCSAAGTYSANSSSTYEYIASNFDITYADGSESTGDYVKDKITIGGSTLTSQQFGIGYTSSTAEGILGVGYESNEVWAGSLGLTAYANVPANMVVEGLISSNAFSLWLNDLDASTGSILFGGVDTDKFEGTLSTLPIQKEDGIYSAFLVTLTALSYGSTSIASDEAIAVLLDSGTSLTYLPDAMTETLYEQVSAEYDSSYGAAFVPCSLASSSDRLNFTFSDPVISIAMSEMILDISSSDEESMTFSDGSTACLFGVAPAGDSTPVLGDTFLRSAYVVYDLTNNEISLAQTKFNVTTSNVLEITNGTSGVPSATLVANAATATADTESGSIAGSTVTLGVATSTAGSSAAKITGVPMGAMAAVGAGMLYAAM